MLTFLFTDIAGSSSLWQSHPQAMRGALAVHDDIVRFAITDHHGTIVKSTGDGFHAAFDQVADAAAAALEAQKNLAAYPWTETGPLPVRMGLHTGDAEARAGDYYGPAVNKAARIMSLAGGGQILLSDVSTALLAESPTDSFHTKSLGSHRLKGLAGRTALHQLVHSDLPSEFAPIRGGEDVPSNLPEELTSFVGREAETERLIDYLLDTETDSERRRLVTLIGPGGTGKTRLSLRAARLVREAFSDGVWLIELAPLTDPASIPGAVLGALGIQETTGVPPEQTITTYLRDRQALLVFDNCEHLVEAVARLIERVLQAAPLVQVLASSREALGIHGETVLRIPSLPLPGEDEMDWEAVRGTDAVRLFAERAEAAGAGRWLSAEHGPAIARICRRLDGIPLALEMAAARLRVFSPAQILERLDDRFRLLTGGTRTALPRLQTLQALIDWSYDLLDEEEKGLFQDLSVFAGGWTIGAAEAVCPDRDVYTLLPQLVDKSLVTAEPGDASFRYHYLETMRQYARDRLMESGRAAEVRDRHLAYFVDATVSKELVDTRRTSKYFLGVAPELENCRTALTWAVDRDPLRALELAGNLVTIWSTGSLREGQAWIERALAVVEPRLEEYRDAGDGERAVRALGLGCLAHAALLFASGHTERAIERSAQAAGLFRQVGDHHRLRDSLALYALAGLSIGIREPALEALDEAEAMASEDDASFTRAILFNLRGLAKIYLDMDLQGAAALMEQAVAIDPTIATQSISGIFALIKIHSLAKNWERARELTEIGLESVRQSAHPTNKRLFNMYTAERAHVERMSGNFDAALNIYARMIVSYREISMDPAVANILECFAMIAVAKEQPGRAARLFGAAEALRTRLGADMTAYERMEYEPAVAILKGGMDTAAFEGARAAGAGMDVDAAIEFARDYANG
ncbi:MAG TPA: adenylate/guanylate cyclase domain-containing protein [Anaerolineales bacterium]|nr:adenylate/guanylate cyclase domain-containing protein [Anaerolineales bacterium]